MEAAIRLVKSLFEDYAQNVPKMNEDVLIRVMEEQDPHQLFCLIGQNTMLSYEQKQELLEQDTDYLRLQRLAAILDHETNVMVIEQDLFDTVRENLDRNQRGIRPKGTDEGHPAAAGRGRLRLRPGGAGRAAKADQGHPEHLGPEPGEAAQGMGAS